MKIEEVFNTTNGQTREAKIDAMIGGIRAIREGLRPKSMSQLAIHFKQEGLSNGTIMGMNT